MLVMQDECIKWWTKCFFNYFVCVYLFNRL